LGLAVGLTRSPDRTFDAAKTQIKTQASKQRKQEQARYAILRTARVLLLLRLPAGFSLRSQCGAAQQPEQVAAAAVRRNSTLVVAMA
ncbi:MAG: hypothetical protein Q9157_007536, partial [Trypethelium eluteriae]